MIRTIISTPLGYKSKFNEDITCLALVIYNLRGAPIN